MSERATSLLRTVLHPVRSLLPQLAGWRSGGLPATPHHNIPAVNLQGVILERAHLHDASLATEMYSGVYRFGSESASGLPDTIFTSIAPSPEWRAALLRMDWLSCFRASGKTLHGLFALRLISAWVSARPNYARDDDRIAALYNLAVDAPALAASQSPAAIAVAQAAILQAWQPVAQMKPKSLAQALPRCIAQLAAHLAIKSPDSQRAKLFEELATLVVATVANDGSHASGRTEDAIGLLADLDLLARGLAQGGERLSPQLAEGRSKILDFLSLLMRADGSLAFHTLDKMALPRVAMRPESVFASVAGYARMASKDSVVFVAAGEEKSSLPLRMELHSQSQSLFWLEEHASTVVWRRGQGQMICATGGSLLELNTSSRHGDNRKISLFLAASGQDFRLENSDGNACYDLWFPDAARLSTTHGGAGALITLGKLGNWQLLARNCVVTQDGTTLRISAQSPAAPMNFALKLVEREARRKKVTARSEAGRLL